MSFSSSEQIPSIPAVTLSQLERLDREDPKCLRHSFLVQQLRLFMFCSSRIEGKLDAALKKETQSEFSLIYAGLRTAVWEAQPKLGIRELPRVAKLGMQLGNSGLEFETVVPKEEIMEHCLEERLALYQPHLTEHLINYTDRHHLKREESDLVITTAGFVYNALERQIEIDALERDLQESVT